MIQAHHRQVDTFGGDVRVDEQIPGQRHTHRTDRGQRQGDDAIHHQEDTEQVKPAFSIRTGISDILQISRVDDKDSHNDSHIHERHEIRDRHQNIQPSETFIADEDLRQRSTIKRIEEHPACGEYAECTGNERAADQHERSWRSQRPHDASGLSADL